ncbi:metalloregulator ArsR/SmtB family transcription factor [Nocardia puris]|uniref:L-amino acid N-acyltransferase YncA n=1 Tax=Nocardia puris TaxID=208602 RepID=A0A366E3G9_9NOCA|nr:metalloregulator ArsR/SmtB family transcription factor [Nocardia puris]MBF6214768.1 metalloregulator ArsR/SmtB family transcription factor [Nocardia puris]MBF6368758.1 metalloregulator ArsR/SmtB family transcription factor [Nocardia puris]MBF6462338.1 metalloregulator ArsR/SmtB family transcription factor [Nocardia puris]RBO96921.1 L-amino acid N-acyltransferase YncA [Nocardia puris]
MTALDMPTVRTGGSARDDALPVAEATRYAGWFATLADPTRVRLLHQVATRAGGITVGELAEALGIGQPTVSHHLRKLAETGFVTLHKNGTSTVVAINPACCTGLPHAADAVMGVLAPRPCCPSELPPDVSVRAATDADAGAIREICSEAAEFDAVSPADPTAHWLPDHRWVAEVAGRVVGWTALSPVSDRPAYRGVAESEIYVTERARGRGIGKSLLFTQVVAADEAGLWTVQTSLSPENRAALALHHSAGYRTVGVRERVVRVGDAWRDAVFLERRSPVR